MRFYRRSKMPIMNHAGQGLTEYLILMVLISVVCIAASKSVGSTVKRKLEMVNRHINQEVDLGK